MQPNYPNWSKQFYWIDLVEILKNFFFFFQTRLNPNWNFLIELSNEMTNETTPTQQFVNTPTAWVLLWSGAENKISWLIHVGHPRHVVYNYSSKTTNTSGWTLHGHGGLQLARLMMGDLIKACVRSTWRKLNIGKHVMIDFLEN